MKTNLSHILPVWKACQILGEATVERIVAGLLRLRSQQTQNRRQQSSEEESDTNAEQTMEKDIDNMVKALFYRHPPPRYPDAPLPPTVLQSWKRWSSADAKPNLRLEKSSLLHYVVPSQVQPHGGPSGHMGLFDCLVYTLQGHATTSTGGNYYYGGSQPNQGILVPDVIILLAIAKEYQDMRKEQLDPTTTPKSSPKNKKSGAETPENVSEDEGDEDAEEDGTKSKSSRGSLSDAEMVRQEKIVWTMALLAFRIYDSYQKKGVVARDTVHRFLTDVYGEDSYKTAETKALLDIIFEKPGKDGDDGEDGTDKNDGEDQKEAPSSPSAGGLHATVSELDFCKRVLDTFDGWDDDDEDEESGTKQKKRPYVLLDWIATLTYNLIPPKTLPPSVSAYLEKMDQRPLPLCDMYALGEHRLYEIKRRFHSMVQTTSTVIQGDPMSDESAAAMEGEGNESPGTTSSSTSAMSQPPKQAITETAFCDAVANPNEEMGSGGYLPRSVAKLVFREGCHRDPYNITGGGYWSFYHVLYFGCRAVRRNVSARVRRQERQRNEKKEDDSVELTKREDEEKDNELLRFIFGMFQLSTGEDVEDLDRSVLTRDQVTQMLVLLFEFSDFRRMADTPVASVVDDSQMDDDPSLVKSSSSSAIEDYWVDEESAFILGILPSNVDSADKALSLPGRENSSFIRLGALVDYSLEGTVSKDKMTFEEFCIWNKSSPKGGPSSRLSVLMLELRLVAAVLFGIPPTEASMEVRLIGEIEARHKERYPQSETSRRGPRGTVWYIIESGWYRQWASVVRNVSKTDMNAKDVRDSGSQGDKTRGSLGRISNTGLLATDGSLALRSDIRWKHDYEIVPPLGWSALQAWYDGGPPIYRSVVRYMTSGSASPHANAGRPRIPTENELELYPFFVTVYLCDAVSLGEARPFQQNYQLSRVSPVRVMLLQLCRELDVDPDLARLWVMEKHPDAGLLVKSGDAVKTNTSEDWILNLEMNIVEQRKKRGVADHSGKGISLLLEIKDSDSGLWPRGIDGKEWSFKEKDQKTRLKTDLGDGVIGLYNMGNTCYLNSSIQCISHTPIFREYFTSKAYLRDINKTNPLGHEGQLAQVSAVLINSLWKRFEQSSQHQPNRVKSPGSYAMVTAPSLTPKTFKESLGKFNDHFSGNEQHDAQEFLAFLLGGLSEDLNRIVNKPYIEAPDSDGRPDQELADIWWSNHLKRELSIIVALFTGQYKSLLTCRTCGYESARFEPFNVLQLPLPENDFLSVSLILYPLGEGKDTMKYCVRVLGDGKLRDVLVALAKIIYSDQKDSDIPVTKAEQGDDESSAMYDRLSRNLAVVDMRDGYIAKIAPVSWSLQDLQNKDTGELPLLHVYELDPLKADGTSAGTIDKSEASTSESAGGSENEGKYKKPKQGFLAVAQRRSEVVSQQHLHPFAHRVFGTPLLLRVDDLEQRTGREIYDLIAARLRNFVPKAAQRFLVGSDTSGETSPGAAREDIGDAPAKSKSRSTVTIPTTTDMEDVSAGSVPRYGFRLRLTSRDGRRCLTCPWYECCIGCLIPDDDATATVMDGDCVTVDWHFAVDLATSGFGTRSSPLDPISTIAATSRPKMYSVPVKNHSSCGGVKKPGYGGAITLEDCLDAFAKEEKIPDSYCSKCKEMRLQTKRMSLWRLPPVVIIHLKRFQFTQHMRRKLRDLVIFPVEGLDLSRIMASDSDGGKEKDTINGLDKQTDENGLDTQDDENDPARLKDGGREEMLYDLYGVVHHQGALSGGHYVASLKSELDGQWRLFNDAQIYEIHSRDVVDASAYILFYIRRDAAKAQLSDFWDVRGEGAGVSEEDMENLMKGRSDRCVIS